METEDQFSYTLKVPVAGWEEEFRDLNQCNEAASSRHMRGKDQMLPDISTMKR